MKALFFALLAVLQLGVALAMIARYEAVLAYGAEYKFLCAPVDPVENFRGRYVALNFAIASDQLLKPDSNGFNQRNSLRWLVLERDAGGFAKIASVSKEKPSSGDFVECRLRWGWAKLPFDEYFMNEDLAPKAEAAYRNAARRPSGAASKDWKPDCYLRVKTWHGLSAAEGLFVNGKPVEELLKERKKP